MTKAIEKNIWANWILYHEFSYHAMRSAQAMSRSGPIVIEEEVLDELRRLDVIYRKNSGYTRKGPIHGIKGAIDTKRETKKLNNWAKGAKIPIDSFDIRYLAERKMPALPNAT